MRKLLGILLLLVFLCAVAEAQKNQLVSTPEDRARFLAIAHKLETSPLDESLSSEREWAIKWATDVTDIHIIVCPSALGDFYSKKSKYKYAPEITVQLLLSAGAYVIEHPDAPNGEAAQAVAGARGALKAYGAILKQDSKATNKPLEDLRQKETAGQLEAYVGEKCSGNSK